MVLWLCAVCKKVTIHVINEVDSGRTTPPYDDSVKVLNAATDAKLIDVMSQAQTDGNFTYESTFYPKWGAFITTINGLKANSTRSEYWQILGGQGMSPLQLGPSSYDPVDGEEVLFRLQTWENNGYKYA